MKPYLESRGSVQQKNRVVSVVAILAMTLTIGSLGHAESAWARGANAAGIGGDSGAGGSSSGGGASGSSGGDDGSGGGTSGVASGGCVPAESRPGMAPAPCLFFASTDLVAFPRSRTAAGLTAAQERTWDAFGQCATRGAMIEQLHVNGSFTFQAASQPDARATKECMTKIGYHFDY